MRPNPEPGVALTDRGRAVALTFRLRELAERLPERERRALLDEMQRIVATYRKSRVPLLGRITA